MSDVLGPEFVIDNPGRDCQAVGTANFWGVSPADIHGDTIAVLGNQGDSNCYLGVEAKVDAIQQALLRRSNQDGFTARIISPYFSGGVSDGQRNGTDEMRYSLIGRQVTNEGFTLHLKGSKVEGAIAVVACDKPPVGALVALLEHNKPAIIMSDGSIRPGTDSVTGERIDIVNGFQCAGSPDEEYRRRVTAEACPGYGSCGGMFTYNTMQTFIGVLGMQPLDMISPVSEDERRVEEFPDRLVDYLAMMMEEGITPRDIVTKESLRNAMIVTMAMGGSTNVVLHAPEIARAAGFEDFWTDVMTQDEFNELSAKLPVLINARPFGAWSMMDIDEKGGVQVIVKELLNAGFLDGSCLTCTGQNLSEQVAGLNPPSPDGEVIWSVENPFKPTGGLRLLKGNLAPEGGAVIKIAGVEDRDLKGSFVGKARVFDSEKALIEALEQCPDVFEDKDMVVIRYEGPRGAPGMPEMLDPTSRITTLCRDKSITIGLMTDARFSGGSVGLVIGHVSPEASEGGPIALIKDGDTIVADLANNTLNCDALDIGEILDRRKADWESVVAENGGTHPNVKAVDDILLRRMRGTASTALQGAGMSDPTGVSVYVRPRN